MPVRQLSFRIDIDDPAMTSQVMGTFAHTAIKQPPDTRTVIEIFVIDLVSDERKDSIRPLAKAP